VELITSLDDDRATEVAGIKYTKFEILLMRSLRAALKEIDRYKENNLKTWERNKTLRAERDAALARFTAPIVCICGSTRFKQSWISENARLTGEGNIVLAVGLWGHHERKYPNEETKKKLDELHLRKIDLCDWVWVLDVGGYIGESTRNEITYAKAHGKLVRYLSKEIPDYTEPGDPLAAALARVKELECQKKALQQVNEEAEAALSALRVRIERVADERDAAQKELHTLRAEADALREEGKRLKEDIIELHRFAETHAEVEREDVKLIAKWAGEAERLRKEVAYWKGLHESNKCYEDRP
jgi:hypothetical protein